MASGDPACEPWEAWRLGLKRASRPIEAALAGWHRLERRTVCHAAGRIRGSKLKGGGAATAHAPRIEVLWLNPAAAAACGVVV